MERREAPAFLATGTRQDGRLVRHSVLHPLVFARGRKGKTACPGPQRIRAKTLGCLKIESKLSPPHPEERPKGASRRMQAASWFETRRCATLLTMRRKFNYR